MGKIWHMDDLTGRPRCLVKGDRGVSEGDGVVSCWVKVSVFFVDGSGRPRWC